MTDALRALLHGVVDYAGLFPPAALDMDRAVREYEDYRTSPDAWMLGRFVVPVARLDEFARSLEKVHRSGPGDWQVSALLGSDAAEDVRRVRELDVPGVSIDTLEGKASSEEEIVAMAGHSAGDFAVFAELPVAKDPEELVAAVKRAGINAKIRTGGVTKDAFPDARDVVRFMRRCIEAGVAFKATAGLHHPIRATYPLTYADDAPRGMMFGYLNVFLAAAAIARGATDDDARRLLEEENPAAFEISNGAVTWHGRRFDAASLSAARRHAIVSFGSCSFREPVDDLRALGFLA